MASAEARIRGHLAAIEAGVDPAAMVEAINEAQSQRAAARAELDGLPTRHRMSAADVERMVDSLGDMAAALGCGSPDKRAILYDALPWTCHTSTRSA